MREATMPSQSPDPDRTPAVVTRDLVKVYRVPASLRRQARQVHGRALPEASPALNGLDLEVRPGEVYGVLGPNGAGKTTLMKVLGTILLPDAGDARVFGEDVRHAGPALRSRIGIVLGEYERSFHWRLTGRQNLRFFADFYGLPRNEVTRRIEDVLDEVGLGSVGDDMFNTYSTGMKHRLALARGLLPDPDLLILDEPTAGLDAHSSGQIAEAVRARANVGTTVLYTTHRIHEAGVLCDRILVLDRGRAVAEASPDELALLARGNQVVEVTKRGGGPWERDFVAPLAERPEVIDWETRGDRLLFYTRNEPEPLAGFVSELRRLGRETLSITVRPPSVEDAFIALIDKRRKEEART
ncbi:MAG: ABC transporter ATP-binding protein [Euryarchaeota archaeon]|nr:ABC transporter ATP-binding protein [Euryarchaeota archaeon]